MDALTVGTLAYELFEAKGCRATVVKRVAVCTHVYVCSGLWGIVHDWGETTYIPPSIQQPLAARGSPPRLLEAAANTYAQM